jgi:hypothetical protein
MDVAWKYISLMNDIVSGKASKDFPSSKFPSCERNGVDQGVHNVLIHKNRIPHTTIWRQQDSLVLNMQAGMYSLRNGIEVLNKNGAPAAVCHQYDRNQDLQKKLFKEVINELCNHLSRVSFYLFLYSSLCIGLTLLIR